MPGSSPEQKTGFEDIQYKYQHGKAPMIEKRDSRYRNMMSKENGTADARLGNKYNAHMEEGPTAEKYNYVPEQGNNNEYDYLLYNPQRNIVKNPQKHKYSQSDRKPGQVQGIHASNSSLPQLPHPKSQLSDIPSYNQLPQINQNGR